MKRAGCYMDGGWPGGLRGGVWTGFKALSHRDQE